MKRKLLDFTTGSQLLGHFGFMFAAGLKLPLIVAVAVIGGTSWWMLSEDLSDHERYLVWMRIYAAIYGFMEFDPAKLVNLETGFGGSIQLPISLLTSFPPVAQAWEKSLAILGDALLRSALILAPLLIAFTWIAARFGNRSKQRKHERGAMLATLPELIQEIREHNGRERTRELTGMMGSRWRLASKQELQMLLPYEPSRLAAVTYPWRLEQSHAMLIGTTGMGKTVALSDMIEEARRKRQRAVIFDLTGTFIEHFYRSDRDIILNPLDARCPQWSVFDECRDEAEFSAAAEALVPHDGGGSEQFWVLAARLLFVEMCLKLRERGKASNEALAAELMTADLTQVHKLMRGTIADPLTAPEAARMAESIRAVFNANAKALKLLPQQGEHFSVRQWIESDTQDGSMLFISARYIDMSVCSQLLTVWLDTAMNTLMAMDRTPDLRLWFFIDELGALHRLPALEKGLQTARNFGGAIVTGIHAFAKLKEVYGENMAMTLSSLARTKLILGTADRETATWCSDFIGHRQVREMEEGYTYGYNNARDAVSLTPRKVIEPLLLPDQLMNLPRLSGYLKFPDGFPAAPVKLTPVTRTKYSAPFIRRADDKRPDSNPHPQPAAPERPASGGQAADEHPASNDDGAGKPVIAKQSELPLALRTADAELDRKEAEEDGASSRKNASNNRTEQHASSSVQATPKKADKQQPPVMRVAMPKDAVLRSDAAERDLTHTSPQGPSTATSPNMAQPKQPTGSENTSALRPPKEARKLMLEDGLSERPEVDLGDLDMDM